MDFLFINFKYNWKLQRFCTAFEGWAEAFQFLICESAIIGKQRLIGCNGITRARNQYKVNCQGFVRSIGQVPARDRKQQRQKRQESNSKKTIWFDGFLQHPPPNFHWHLAGCCLWHCNHLPLITARQQWGWKSGIQDYFLFVYFWNRTGWKIFWAWIAMPGGGGGC